MVLAIECLAAILCVSFLIQAFLVWGFVRRLNQFSVELLSDAQCPSAAVILCLRGGDPFLARCLEGLFKQNYPHYRVLVVLDSPSDPAGNLLSEFLQRTPDARVELLSLDPTIQTRCSLKCASLLQALEYLGNEVDFIAQLDADTIPHETWLRELATGLKEEDVGAATGNRWYMPEIKTPGSMVRYVWNAAAVVQMYWYGIAWGGSIAVKCSAIREAKLHEKWSRSLCEDTMLFLQLKGILKRVFFVPSLMMVNREACDLKGFYPWVRRQLLTAKLYHPSWLAVVGHGLSSALFLLVGWGGALICFLMLTWDTFWAGICLVLLMMFFQVGLTLLLWPMERAVRRIAENRGEKSQWLGGWEALVWFPVVFLTQGVYTRALISSLFLRKVDWRGIEYRVGGAWDIERLEYRPYQSDETESLKSL